MIYLSTATYFEGETLIKMLSLKKDNSITKFQVFKSQDVTLIITGCGRISSTAALTYLFSIMNPASTDLLINYGICGTVNKDLKPGTTCLCSKISEHSTGKTFYTDVLYKSPFQENSLETFDTPVTSHNTHIEGEVIDMEASGIYQAATLFLMTHQIYFIKMVSDYIGDNIHKDDIKNKLNDSSQRVVKWIKEISPQLVPKGEILSPKDIELLNDIAANLKYSVTMKNELRKKFIYCKLSTGVIPLNLKRYSKIPCKSKKEGQVYGEAIDEELI